MSSNIVVRTPHSMSQNCNTTQQRPRNGLANVDSWHRHSACCVMGLDLRRVDALRPNKVKIGGRYFFVEGV